MRIAHNWAIHNHDGEAWYCCNKYFFIMESTDYVDLPYFFADNDLYDLFSKCGKIDEYMV